MRRFLFLLTVVVFAVGVAAPSQGATSKSTSETFPISLVDNRTFVSAKVDGHGPFSFLLDTGSSSVTVERPLALLLKLKTLGGGTTDGAGESTVGYDSVSLASFDLGKIALGPMVVPSLDDAALSRAIGFTKFDGVLGADIFRKHVVTLDVQRAQLTVEDPSGFHPAKDATAISMDLNGDETPVVTATINGITSHFIVDTGDRSSLTLFGPFWRKNGLDRAMMPTVTAMTGFGLGGPIRAMVGRPARFSIGGIAVPAPVTRLSLQRAGVFTSADYAGSIGMGVLKRFVVSFDYLHKKMWLRKSSDFAQADRYDRSGAWLGLDQAAHVVVMDLAQDGPAQKAGIRQGDAVAKIEDVTGDAAHLFGLRALLKQPKLASATFHLVRENVPMAIVVHLADLIAPPSM